ncbi:hypothetical protein LWI28_024399 [Acer negundo]|uniref:Uncharacterized protein n=1 Tax=Acer negundo TaxID=4023 RepID=A0AAD5JMT3_ACENE|nr:hypothetical protein LWI28_024399 [Acer negundo]
MSYHLKIPTAYGMETSFITIHANEKTNTLNEKADIGPLPYKEYSYYMTTEPDDINWLVLKDMTKGYRDDPPTSPSTNSGAGGHSNSSKT